MRAKSWKKLHIAVALLVIGLALPMVAAENTPPAYFEYYELAIRSVHPDAFKTDPKAKEAQVAPDAIMVHPFINPAWLQHLCFHDPTKDHTDPHVAMFRYAEVAEGDVSTDKELLRKQMNSFMPALEERKVLLLFIVLEKPTPPPSDPLKAKAVQAKPQVDKIRIERDTQLYDSETKTFTAKIQVDYVDPGFESKSKTLGGAQQPDPVRQDYTAQRRIELFVLDWGQTIPCPNSPEGAEEVEVQCIDKLIFTYEAIHKEDTYKKSNVAISVNLRELDVQPAEDLPAGTDFDRNNIDTVKKFLHGSNARSRACNLNSGYTFDLS